MRFRQSAILAVMLFLLASCLGTGGPGSGAEGGGVSGLSLFQLIELQNLEARAVMLEGQEKYAESLAEYLRVMPQVEKGKGKDDPVTLAFRSRLARAYVNVEDLKSAQEQYTLVYKDRVRVLGQNHPDTLISACDLAEIYGYLGEYAIAKDMFTQAIATMESTMGQEHPDTLNAYERLASVCMYSGEYPKARELLLRTLKGRERILGKNHVNTLNTRNVLAALYFNLGDYITAKDMQEEVIRTLERIVGDEHPFTYLARTNIVRIYGALGEYDTAQKLATRTYNHWVRTTGKDSSPAANIQHHLAEIAFDRGDYRGAIPLLKESITSMERLFGPSSVLDARAKLADAYTRTGDHGQAKKLAADALLRAQSSAGKQQPVTGLVACSLGSAYYAGKQSEVAIFYSKIGVLATRQQRDMQQGLDRDLQQTFLATVEERYHTLISALLASKRMEEAQAVLYFLKEDELDDASRGRLQGAEAPMELMVGKEVGLYKEYNRLSDTLYALGGEQKSLSEKQRFTPLSAEEKSRLGELEKQLKAEQANFTRFMAKAERELAGSGEASRRAASGMQNLKVLRQILTASGQGSVVIHTLSGDSALYVFLTTPSGLTVRSLPMGREQLKAEVENLRVALRDPGSDPRPAAQNLCNLIIKPIQPELRAAKAKTLLFSLDGSLRYVPMSALHDGQGWLVESYNVAMFTEAARHTLTARPSAQPRVAAMGVTKALAGFSALPAVAEEVRGIVKDSGASAGVVPGTVDLDSAFTRQAFSRRLQDGAPLVHLASHFQFEPAAQASSFLLLGDGSKLTMADMFIDESLRFEQVDLLTLSACDTASGLKKGDGREVESFGAMAQKHGAKAVLAALWPVSDSSTAGLMQEFYRLRAEGKGDKAQALCEAQRAFARGETPGVAGSAQRGKLGGSGAVASTAFAGYAHPYYWAPFILMGNWQ